MGTYFDIGPRKTRPAKKTPAKSKAKSAKKKSGSFISYLIIFVIIIAIISFGKSNTSQDTSSLPENSIENNILAEKIENESETIATPVQVETTNQMPDNPSKDLSNSVSEQDEEITEENIENSIDNNTMDTLNRLDLKLKILNGSGKSGIAAQVKEELESAGYIVAEIGTANNSYTNSIIYFAPKEEDAAIELAQSLSTATSQQENFTVTGEFDLVLVVGSNYID